MRRFYTDGPNQVKKTLVMLKMMKGMLRHGHKPDKVSEYALEFEKELLALYNKSKAISLCFGALSSFINLDDYRPDFFGGEGFECYENFNPIAMLLNDKTFDLNRIDEIINLFESLVKLSIFGIRISGESSIEEINSCFCPIPLSSSTPDFNREKRYIGEQFSILKVFSNAEIKYSLSTDKTYDDTDESFCCDFVTTPQWIISGEVLYNEKKEIYLGWSSPHTHFDFSSASFYVDPMTLPTREELYSPNETTSLKLFKESKYLSR